MMPPPRRHPRTGPIPDPDTLGRTEPNAAGFTYRHGTLSGYSARECRCENCRAAYAIYRAGRREAGKDQPRPMRTSNTDGHISRRWFRDNVWLPAREGAGLSEGVKVHSLRHAHASWVLAGGADIAVVKERLGHSLITTTQKYVHKPYRATALTSRSRHSPRSATAANSQKSPPLRPHDRNWNPASCRRCYARLARQRCRSRLGRSTAGSAGAAPDYAVCAGGPYGTDASISAPAIALE